MGRLNLIETDVYGARPHPNPSPEGEGLKKGNKPHGNPPPRRKEKPPPGFPRTAAVQFIAWARRLRVEILAGILVGAMA